MDPHPGMMAPTTRDAEAPIPLGWAGAPLEADYVNFGDAMSPVMVALVSGRGVRRVAYESAEPRMAAVGTIGHGFRGGEVQVWGTGCSRWANPSAPRAQRQPYAPPAGTRLILHATRGPISQHLLSGGAGGPNVFGDPVWLLPRFYRPQIRKKWALGVVLHLSDLADRAHVAHPLPGLKRYQIPPGLSAAVHLITTATAVDVGALKAKVDEILACERIVSQSLHGLVVAEAYGIPCLYFPPAGGGAGLCPLDLAPDTRSSPRIADLYGGLGLRQRMGYAQHPRAPTDWEAVMRAIDAAWSPVDLDGDRLMDAFPRGRVPLGAAPGEDVWSHPVVRTLQLRHDVAQLQIRSRRRSAWLRLLP